MFSDPGGKMGKEGGNDGEGWGRGEKFSR